MKKEKLPELLAPCGDKDALISAIAGGADAVYLGLDIFNARIRAKNFTLDSLEEAVSLAHAHNVKVYVTLNTELYDRELSQMLDYVDKMWTSGVDALIVADFGAASLIRKFYPDFEIHGSTQCTAHNLDGVSFLYEKLGFLRVVLARELSKENISYISKNANAETEIFVHGAHCMSVSGGCLMSYAMGGRSGNRGECAQPCRLPYTIGSNNGYHLSLKDMSLSSHIEEIIESGTSSLKIEGRMKSADYVFGTVSIWRRMLNERRSATSKEKSRLEALFSRQGFTDGYFTSNITSKMLGVRSEQNKSETKSLDSNVIELKKPKLSVFGRFILGEKANVTVKIGDREATAYGDIVESAINAPTSYEDIKKNLSKFGSTPYVADKIEIEKSDNIMVRVSTINGLRRSAYEMATGSVRESREHFYKSEKKDYKLPKIKTALFLRAEQIPENKDYFDIIYLPLEKYKSGAGANGVMLPPVVFDNEWEEIDLLLDKAKSDGIKYALVSNIGQIERVKSKGFKLMADFRFNVFNAPCVQLLMESDIENVILSPELTLPQANDLKGVSLIAYGKIPVMTTHKCVLRDTVGCEKCRGYLKDRQNAKFYVEGAYGHRNIMYNSVPIYMADKLSQIKDHSLHFIFSDESREECYKIVESYKRGLEPSFPHKRIK